MKSAKKIYIHILVFLLISKLKKSISLQDVLDVEILVASLRVDSSLKPFIVHHNHLKILYEYVFYPCQFRENDQNTAIKLYFMKGFLRRRNHNKLSLQRTRLVTAVIFTHSRKDLKGKRRICDFLMFSDDSAERAWNLIIVIQNASMLGAYR